MIQAGVLPSFGKQTKVLTPATNPEAFTGETPEGLVTLVVDHHYVTFELPVEGVAALQQAVALLSEVRASK